MMRIIVAGILLLQTITASGQELRTWHRLNVEYIQKKMCITLEGQLRSAGFYRNFNYYELKGGISKNISKQTNVELGIGSYQAYAATGDFVLPKTMSEFRTWLQVENANQLSWGQINLRARLEQRFLASGYRDRLRLRGGVTLKLSNSWKVMLQEEAFISFEPCFMQHRLTTGLGYRFTNQFSLHANYVFQHNFENNQRLNAISFSFLFKFYQEGLIKQKPHNIID